VFDCGCYQEVGHQGFRRNNKGEEEMSKWLEGLFKVNVAVQAPPVQTDTELERFIKAFINRSDTRLQQLSEKLASVDGIIREVDQRWSGLATFTSRSEKPKQKRKYTKRSKYWKKAAAVVLLSGLALGSANAQSIYNPYATNVYNPFNPAPVVPAPVLNPPVDVIGR